MFKYVGDISDIAHNIIDTYVENKTVAIDGTLGNGHDTDFLRERFQRVYAFEIQREPWERYIDKSKDLKDNVVVINDSHHKLKEYVKEKVNCIIYNLGYLPGGDKNITTIHDTSLISIKEGLELLEENGIMIICIYRGHNEGAIEETCILSYLENLDKNKYGVMVTRYLNRNKKAPILVVVEKK